MSPRALAAAAIAAGAVHLAARALGPWQLAAVAKPVPVLLLAAWVLGRPRDRYVRLVGAGLLLSALGDALLVSDGLFREGLAAFLCAHLCYTAAFVHETRRPALLRALPFALFGVGAFAFLRAGLGAMTPYVAVYMAAICAMMWRAAALPDSRGAAQPWQWAALWGAIVFAASDSLIALDKFHAPIAHVGFAIMILYWAGQVGIASSAVRRATPAAR